jgi:PHAX RNA-binding domain-containing protein
MAEAQKAAASPPQRVTAEQLAQVLQEPNVPLLQKVLWLLGADRTTILLVDALQIEAAGGMLTNDGTRRRTTGGVFFQLVREQTTRYERYLLFPRGGHPLTWADVHALTPTLAAHPAGEACMIKLSIIGRPEKVETRDKAVIFRLQGKPPASLPRGLPPIPNTPALTWTVMVSLRQWNRVKDSLATNEQDAIVVEGYPVQRGSQLVLMAQSCISVALQRAQKQARQQQADETPP